jgi:hypothetical protein
MNFYDPVFWQKNIAEYNFSRSQQDLGTITVATCFRPLIPRVFPPWLATNHETALLLSTGSSVAKCSPPNECPRFDSWLVKIFFCASTERLFPIHNKRVIYFYPKRYEKNSVVFPSNYKKNFSVFCKKKNFLTGKRNISI